MSTKNDNNLYGSDSLAHLLDTVDLTFHYLAAVQSSIQSWYARKPANVTTSFEASAPPWPMTPEELMTIAGATLSLAIQMTELYPDGAKSLSEHRRQLTLDLAMHQTMKQTTNKVTH